MQRIDSNVLGPVGFVFDKIHVGPAATLLAAAETDNIMIGRFVLVKYCETNFLPSLKELLEQDGDISHYPEDSDARMYLTNFLQDKKTYSKYGYFCSKDRMIYQKLYDSTRHKVVYKETGYFGRVSTIEENGGGGDGPEVIMPDLDDLLYINNTPLPASLGGVLKENHKSGFDSTMKELLDELLYPYVAPTISNLVFQDDKGKLSNSLEKGVATPKQITKISVELAKGSANMEKITFYNGSNYIGAIEISSSAIRADYTLASHIELTDKVTIKAELKDAIKDVAASASGTINVYYPIYYGKIEESNDVTSTILSGASKSIRSVGNMALTYPATNVTESIFIAYPANSGAILKNVTDPAGFTQTWTRTSIWHKLADDSEIEYYVYKSPASQRDANSKYTFNF